MPTLADVARRLAEAGALARDLPPQAQQDRIAAEARESGMAVTASPWGPSLSEADAGMLYRSLRAAHDRQATAEAQLAGAQRTPPTPAESATPTPAELHQLAGGDKIAASIYKHGPAVITDERAWLQDAAIQRACTPVGVAVQIPERRMPPPPPVAPAVVMKCLDCGEGITPDGSCACTR